MRIKRSSSTRALTMRSWIWIRSLDSSVNLPAAAFEEGVMLLVPLAPPVLPFSKERRACLFFCFCCALFALAALTAAATFDFPFLAESLLSLKTSFLCKVKDWRDHSRNLWLTQAVRCGIHVLDS